MDNKGLLYGLIALMILAIIGILYYMSKKPNAQTEVNSNSNGQPPLTTPVTIKPLKKSNIKKTPKIVECQFDSKDIVEVGFMVSLSEALKINSSDSKKLTNAKTLKVAEENLKGLVEELAAFNGGEANFNWYGYISLMGSQILFFTAKFGNAHRASITKLNNINLKFIQKCLASSLD